MYKLPFIIVLFLINFLLYILSSHSFLWVSNVSQLLFFFIIIIQELMCDLSFCVEEFI